MTITKRGVLGTAVFSKDKAYRYMAHYPFLPKPAVGGSQVIAFCLLNPSTADQDQLDPTLRRCRSYARAWGYGGMTIVNAFALRATDPKRLLGCGDPIGPHNAAYITEAIRASDMFVVGWGSNALVKRLKIDEAVCETAAQKKQLVYCLGRNKNGSPKHPLYLKKDVRPILYHAAHMAGV